jgi:hypothetical protein
MDTGNMSAEGASDGHAAAEGFQPHDESETGEAGQPNKPEQPHQLQPQNRRPGQPKKDPIDQAIDNVQRKWKLKDKEYEEEVDEQTLVRRATKAYAADRRFEEAASLRKEAEEFFSMAKADPEQFLTRLGYDVDDLAVRRIRHKIDQDMMDPKDLELQKMQSELEGYRQQEQKIEEQKKAQAYEQLKQQTRQTIHQDIIKALDPSGLPKTDYTVERVAKYMLRAKELGYSEVQPHDVMETVRKDYQRDIRHFATGNISSFVDFLGPEVVKKLREHEVGQLANPLANRGFQQTPESKTFGASEPKQLTRAEWKARLDAQTGALTR